MPEQDKREQAMEVVLDRLIRDGMDLNPKFLTELAEAYAWLAVPGMPHGGQPAG